MGLPPTKPSPGLAPRDMRGTALPLWRCCLLVVYLTETTTGEQWVIKAGEQPELGLTQCLLCSAGGAEGRSGLGGRKVVAVRVGPGVGWCPPELWELPARASCCKGTKINVQIEGGGKARVWFSSRCKICLHSVELSTKLLLISDSGT